MLVHFLMTNVLQQQFLQWFAWSTKSTCPFEKLFFFLRLFDLSTRFLPVLTLNQWLTCFGISCAFWVLWMLATMNKLCHVPHVLQITTSGTILTEFFFGVSKEWARSRSHDSLITNLKTLLKNFLAVHAENWTRKKKEKKTRIVTAKLFVLNSRKKVGYWLLIFRERRIKRSIKCNVSKLSNHLNIFTKLYFLLDMFQPVSTFTKIPYFCVCV